MRKRFVAAMASAVVAAAAFAAPASAEEMELKFAHWVPAKHPLHPTGLVPWAESITEASGGSITFAFFPAQQLGSAKDHYDMARDGIADFSWVNPGYTPGRFPVAAAGELPFLIDNAVEGSKAFDAWYRQYAEKEMSDVKYCLAFVHDPGTIHSKEPITHPDDIEGVKVRPAHGTMARFVNLLGGASVQVSAPEAREALAQGTADAITFPWNSIYLFGIDKVTKHHLDMPFYATTFVFAMNKDRYEGMTADQQKAIDDHCTPEWAQKVAKGWAEWEAAGREEFMQDEGHTLHEPTEAEVAAWRDAAEPLQESWAEDVDAAGVDADAAYENLISTLKEHDSLFE